ncbi:MAG: TIGR03986 family CRISPR-associated RAMP protein, partial [Pseudomonadota bacterium]|nr:TIGR03986 family CRISPR-associated RAMP protein [Pseudomonadota bacterium]
PDEVIDTFVQLGHERLEASVGEHPFKPQGYPAWQPEGEQNNLAGHLVFFDIAENQAGQIEVREISLSAIWRQAVAGSSYDFFRKINPNLLPWHPERDVLTPAECLFGVVEEEKRSQDKQARALASRLRFSDGRAVSAVELRNPVTLKILSSPKPPCPALYFHHDQDRRQRRYIAKTELSAQNHRPNGRKVYLHHPQREIERQNWQTRNSDNLDQKMRCQPIQKGQTFYFHIDFDNLSQAELGLLLRSLYPDSTYRHRLGLGKSLGLGTVAVNIEGMFLIDRIKRYESLELDSPRYHQIFSGTTTAATPAWADFYPLEAQCLEQASSPILESCFYNDNTLIEPNTLKILQTVGNPDKLHPNTPVSPPLLLEQRHDPESESFKWFAENEQRDKQAALPLIEAGHTLPTLEQWRGRR